MPTATKAELIVLRGGLSVPLPALQLLWALETRGLNVSADADGLLVAPGSQLTDEDDRAIRRYRDELLALVRYCEGIQ